MSARISLTFAKIGRTGKVGLAGRSWLLVLRSPLEIREGLAVTPSKVSSLTYRVLLVGQQWVAGFRRFRLRGSDGGNRGGTMKSQ